MISWKLSTDELNFFSCIARERKKEDKPFVLWGWKRDKVKNGKRYPESRTVYFSADFSKDRSGIYIKRAYFFLETRARNGEIDYLRKIVGESRYLDKYCLNVRDWKDTEYRGYKRLRMEIGEPCEYDKETVARRLRGKPRLHIESPQLVKESKVYDISEHVPLAVCCGSGLSSESGLPLLGSIHEIFEVDDLKRGELVFGDRDGLPGRLISDLYKELRKCCKFSVDSIKAKPTSSHEILANLYKKGIIRQVFTDNVDDILKKVDMPYTQTRLSIFPDRFAVELEREVKALLVIGVSVDRRDVIKQARKAGLKIIAINPIYGVAPYSRNMDYLKKGDLFFKGKAKDVLPKIVDNSSF